MFHDSSRSAALRRPQSGTPDTISEHDAPVEELIGDEVLLRLAIESPQLTTLCGVLLRTQIATYRRTRHVISFADEYVLRRIRNAGRYGHLPQLYCRCMRCGTLALLIDWCAAADLADDPTMPARRWPPGHRQPVSTAFYAPCAGNEKARDGLLLLN